METPVSGSGESKSRLRISRPVELVKQVREVACRKRWHTPRVSRDLIEAGTRKLLVEDHNSR